MEKNKAFIIRGNNVIGMDVQRVYTSTPIGIIQAFSGTTIPRGFLLCDGQSYAVAEYPDLYAVIGNTYGGDSTNFNVPNLVDKFIQGSTTSGTEKEAGLPNIEGTVGYLKSVANTDLTKEWNGAFKWTTYSASSNIPSQTSSPNTYDLGFDASRSNAIYGNSDTVQPPALTMVYIIKAFHTNEGVDSGVSDDVVEYVEGEIAEVESELNKLTKMEQGMSPLGEMYFNDTPYKKLTAKIVYGRTMVFDVVGGKGKYFGKIFIYQADTATPIVRVVDICGARPFNLKYDNLANTDKSGFYTLDLFIYKSLWDGTLVFKPSSQANNYSSNLYTTSDFVNCTVTDYDNAKGIPIYETLNPLDDTKSSTLSTYSSAKIDEKIDEKIDGTTIQTTTTTSEEYYAITYGDSISTASNQGILIQYKRLNFPPSTYIFSATSYVTNARETVSVAKISNNYAGTTYDLKFYIDKDNKTVYLRMPSYSGVSLQNLAFKSKAVTYTKVDAIPDTATALAVTEYASINNSSTGDSVSTWSSSKIASRLDLVQEVSMDLNYYDETWLAGVPVRSVFCANANKNIPPITDYESYAMGTLTVYLTSRGYIQEYKTYVYENTWKIVTYTRAKIDTTITAWTLA